MRASGRGLDRQPGTTRRALRFGPAIKNGANIEHTNFRIMGGRHEPQTPGLN
jgi:hypothetical protein